MASKTILIVDDDPTQRRLLQAVIERQNFKSMQADCGEKALETLTGPDGASISCVIMDLTMPGLSGQETIVEMRKKGIETPVIVLTASGGIDTVVGAMQAGACDFFVKPASPERIAVSIKNAMQLQALTGEVKRLKRTVSGQLTFKDMIASAPAMRPVVRLAERAAKSNIPILILGESGVGKEVIARAIQGVSDRAGKPFVAVNCGAIPENLVESILFGHEKGAFTGAVDKHIGKFQEADGGTLFLDEVGELPPAVQVKLLRVLQEGEVDPVGAKKPVKINVRLIAATNKDLARLVERDEFREDLFYRLNVFPIEVPPLRARKDDIPALVDHFIQRFNAEEGKRIQGVTPEAMMVLRQHDWPGNVRQLENTIYRGVVLADSEELSLEDFPALAGKIPSAFAYAPAARSTDAPVSGSQGLSAKGPAPHNANEDTDDQRPDPVARPEDSEDLAPAVQAIAEVSHDTISQEQDLALDAPVNILDGTGHMRTLEDIERDLIQFAIETYAGHMSEVARRLGIGRSTLYRKVREQGLDVKLAANDEPEDENTTGSEQRGVSS